MTLNLPKLYRFAFTVSTLFSVFLGTTLGEPQKPAPQKPSFLEMVTGTEEGEIQTRWDKLFNSSTYVYGREPAEFLKLHVSKLPIGKALDLAMGEGRNAVFLAKKGFSVEGVDISEVAMRKARRLAKENRVSLTTINSDLRTYQIKPESYQVILSIDFLQRSLFPQIKNGLKKGGVAVIENGSIEQLKNPSGKTTPREWLLEKGELLEVFKDFEILKYEETNDGKEAKAKILARKR
jgi:SAM-dependent methyltransferase